MAHASSSSVVRVRIQNYGSKKILDVPAVRDNSSVCAPTVYKLVLGEEDTQLAFRSNSKADGGVS